MSRYGIENKLTEYMDCLSEIGADDKGGVTRLLYSDAWKAAQEKVKSIMCDIGMTSEYDAVGNLYGRVTGTENGNETIVVGSHIDTVKNGGKYDGQFGIVTGLVAIEYLYNTFGAPKKNLEVLSISEEEGSRFPCTFWGVKNLLGIAQPEVAKSLVDADGIRFEDAMLNAGFNFMSSNYKKRTDIKNYIEIHIEQGGVLERENKSIGVVTAIVGQRRFNVSVLGQANHAGTTPMGYRKDAVYVTSKMVSAIVDKAKSYGDPMVATIGKIEVSPNAVNVVPGKVNFTVDMRHTDLDTLEEFTEFAKKEMKRIADETDMELTVDMYMSEIPVPMDTGLVNMIIETCEQNNLEFKVMHSGAGHDAQLMAQHYPSAMFFVPSVNGISHNPLEFTETKDLVVGVEAVIDVLKRLAY